MCLFASVGVIFFAYTHALNCTWHEICCVGGRVCYYNIYNACNANTVPYTTSSKHRDTQSSDTLRKLFVCDCFLGKIVSVQVYVHVHAVSHLLSSSASSSSSSSSSHTCASPCAPCVRPEAMQVRLIDVIGTCVSGFLIVWHNTGMKIILYIAVSYSTI